MSKIPLTKDFFTAIIHDPRISPTHISLYMALLHWSEIKGDMNPIYVFSREIMPIAKFSSVATYHRLIRELHEYGYVRYDPTHHPFVGSRVEILEVWEPGRRENW